MWTWTRSTQRKKKKAPRCVSSLRHRGLLPTSSVAPLLKGWQCFSRWKQKSECKAAAASLDSPDCVALKSCQENMGIWRAPPSVIGHTEPLSLFSSSHLELTNPLRSGFGVSTSVQQLSLALTQAASRGSMQKGDAVTSQKTPPAVLRIRGSSFAH